MLTRRDAVRIFGNLTLSRDPPDASAVVFGKPKGAVRSGGNRPQKCARGNTVGILGNLSTSRNPSDFIACRLGVPKRAVRARDDILQSAVRGVGGNLSL